MSNGEVGRDILKGSLAIATSPFCYFYYRLMRSTLSQFRISFFLVDLRGRAREELRGRVGLEMRRCGNSDLLTSARSSRRRKVILDTQIVIVHI